MISHHKFNEQCFLKFSLFFFLATVKGSLAATSISFIINFAVLGIWVSYMLNLGSDSVKRKYMIGFHVSYSLMCKFFIVTFPQLLLRKGNVFTPVCQSFCSLGGCLPQCMLGYTHPLVDTPWADTPGADATPPWADTPHPPAEGHCRGRYASYWNAFLYLKSSFN